MEPQACEALGDKGERAKFLSLVCLYTQDQRLLSRWLLKKTLGVTEEVAPANAQSRVSRASFKLSIVLGVCRLRVQTQVKNVSFTHTHPPARIRLNASVYQIHECRRQNILNCLASLRWEKGSQTAVPQPSQPGRSAGGRAGSRRLHSLPLGRSWEKSGKNNCMRPIL